MNYSRHWNREAYEPVEIPHHLFKEINRAARWLRAEYKAAQRCVTAGDLTLVESGEMSRRYAELSDLSLAMFNLQNRWPRSRRRLLPPSTSMRALLDAMGTIIADEIFKPSESLGSLIGRTPDPYSGDPSSTLGLGSRKLKI